MRHAREESRVGVETGVKEEGHRGAESPSEAGFESSVGMVIDEGTRGVERSRGRQSFEEKSTGPISG